MQQSGPQIVRQETTLAEFEMARKRELARLNVRMLSITGKEFHASEDLALLEGDTSEQETMDMETVRLWSNRSKKRGQRNNPV